VRIIFAGQLIADHGHTITGLSTPIEFATEVSRPYEALEASPIQKNQRLTSPSVTVIRLHTSMEACRYFIGSLKNMATAGPMRIEPHDNAPSDAWEWAALKRIEPVQMGATSTITFTFDAGVQAPADVDFVENYDGGDKYAGGEGNPLDIVVDGGDGQEQDVNWLMRNVEGGAGA